MFTKLPKKIQQATPNKHIAELATGAKHNFPNQERNKKEGASYTRIFLIFAIGQIRTSEETPNRKKSQIQIRRQFKSI